MNNPIAIGRLLRASTTGCVVGCRVSQVGAPSFGCLVRIPLEDGYSIYGLVYDIHIDDDGLVRQLATGENIRPEVIEDNRLNRNVPVELSVLFTGYEQGGKIRHLLPPRPALSLDAMYLCNAEEICAFTAAGRFGYFRHILRSAEAPIGELLAAHMQQAGEAHQQGGDADWARRATQELITVLRDDYPILMSVLGAIADI